MALSIDHLWDVDTGRDISYLDLDPNERIRSIGSDPTQVQEEALGILAVLQYPSNKSSMASGGYEMSS